MSNESRDERLRRLLRAADPAPAVTPGLTPDEIHEMRRTVLSALPERRRGLFPIYATAGGVLVAALILLVVLLPRPVPEKLPLPPRIARVDPRVPPPPPPPAEPRLPEERVEEKKTPVRPIPVEPEETVLLASAEPRQIQFSTPGGTRIVWTLSPEDVVPQGE